MGTSGCGTAAGSVELTIGGCRIRMDFGFPAVLALLFLMEDGEFLCQTLAVCLLHECGHGMAMVLSGAGLSEIRFQAAGMQLCTRHRLLPMHQELAVLLGGPLINLLMAGVLCLTVGKTLPMWMHLGMGLFNLLPYRMLDGGAAIQCILEGKDYILRLLPIFNILLTAGLTALLFLYHVCNPCLYAMGIYLAAAEVLVDKKAGM